MRLAQERAMQVCKSSAIYDEPRCSQSMNFETKSCSNILKFHEHINSNNCLCSFSSSGERQEGGHGEAGVVAAAEGARGERGAGEGVRAGEEDGRAEETAPIAG